MLPWPGQLMVAGVHSTKSACAGAQVPIRRVRHNGVHKPRQAGTPLAIAPGTGFFLDTGCSGYASAAVDVAGRQSATSRFSPPRNQGGEEILWQICRFDFPHRLSDSPLDCGVP